MLTLSYLAVITAITVFWIPAAAWAMHTSRDPARTGRMLGTVGALLGLTCGLSGAIVGLLS